MARPSINQMSRSRKEDIERALEHAAALGITGIHTGSYHEEIEIYRSSEMRANSPFVSMVGYPSRTSMNT